MTAEKTKCTNLKGQEMGCGTRLVSTWDGYGKQWRSMEREFVKMINEQIPINYLRTVVVE